MNSPLDQQEKMRVLRYLNGELSLQERETLQDQLTSDVEYARRFADFVQLASMVREQVRREQGVRRELSLPHDAEVDFDEFLAELMPPEYLPPVELVELVKHGAFDDQEPQETPTFSQAAGLAWQLFIRSRAAVYSASGLAAAVVFSAALYFIFLTGSSGTTDPPVADDAGTPSAFASSPQPVATLTALREGQWQSVPGVTLPGVGDRLRPGQRLSLIAGFAEVTTNDGAIAILEAPCTVELINNNALRLVEGRLLGIVETQRAEGFVVRTPHMDVTDLGTRFGVDVKRGNKTSVHVLEGVVRVALPAGAPSADERMLSAGQAVEARRGSPVLAVIDHDKDRFASIASFQQTYASQDGIRNISGGIQIASATQFIGKQPVDLPSSDDAFVFHELTGRLKSEAMTNLVETGEHDKLPPVPETAVPAGIAFTSYIIIKSGNPTDKTTKIQGSVTFEQEVIGIITEESTAGLFQSAVGPESSVFSPGVGNHRWIDLYSFEESVMLSEDRRTVAFQFQVKQSTDVIRVLVRAGQQD